MLSKVNDTINAMTEYFRGDVRRIHHFMKVYTIARTIGLNEKLPDDVQALVEIAAITHDIGIKNSEENTKKNHSEKIIVFRVVIILM